MSPSDIRIFGTTQDNTIAQAVEVRRNALRVALMADSHLGYVMPVGGVAAYRNQVSVAGVGYDIACGNCAIRTDLRVESFDRARLEAVADEIQSSISFGVGRKNKSGNAPVDHPLFESAAWEAIPAPARGALKEKARAQLGTVGSGNHYVDLFADAEGRIWVGVHFGSRGLGHTLATGFLALAKGEKWGAKVREFEALLDLDSPLGDAYWQTMALAGEYAYAGREWTTREVVRLLGGTEEDLVHNHHNFAWREKHDGEEVVVVRKGATPAFPGQRGFVGGSMGDISVILQGTGSIADPSDSQRDAMFSTVHGAGRVMSRTEAIGKSKLTRSWQCGQRDCGGTLPLGTARGADGSNPKCPRCGSRMHERNSRELVREGKVTPAAMQEWLARTGVLLRGAGLDEAPQVYRRLPDVLAAQGSTIEITEVLTPLVVVMAGAEEFDPYKD
ncbi:MAG: RtcB family protein [Thermoanaerobaculia bacterium]